MNADRGTLTDELLDAVRLFLAATETKGRVRSREAYRLAERAALRAVARAEGRTILERS